VQGEIRTETGEGVRADAEDEEKEKEEKEEITKSEESMIASSK